MQTFPVNKCKFYVEAKNELPLLNTCSPTDTHVRTSMYV